MEGSGEERAQKKTQNRGGGHTNPCSYRTVDQVFRPTPENQLMLINAGNSFIGKPGCTPSKMFYRVGGAHRGGQYKPGSGVKLFFFFFNVGRYWYFFF